MHNIEYAKSHTDKESHQDSMLKAMNKYGENKWWLSENNIVKAYHQINEDILLINISEMYEGISKLLGRNVQNQEYTWGLDSLRKQVEAAWNLRLNI